MPKDSLTKFASVLYNEALEEKQRVEDKLRAEREEILDKKKSEFEARLKRDTAICKAGIEGEIRLSLSRRETELSKVLRQNRTVAANGVFEAAAKRLHEFTRTPQYKEYLRRKLDSVEGEFTSGLTVCAALKEDEEVIRGLCRIDNIEFVTAGSDIIGGFTLKNTELGIFADCTLKSALDDRRGDFFENSGLVID